MEEKCASLQTTVLPIKLAALEDMMI